MRLLYFIKLSMIQSAIILLITSCTYAQSSGMGKVIYPDSIESPASGSYNNNPANSDRNAESYFQAGQSYQQENKLHEAINAYLKALQTMPANDSLVIDICNHLASCYIDEDSILWHEHLSQVNAMQASHAIEIQKQELVVQHQRNTAVLIISSLAGLTSILFLFMYINTHNKKKYIHLQQQLMKNQAEKMQQKNELKQLMCTHQFMEQENRDMQDKLFELWKQTIQICARLFQTTASYKKLMTMETSKLRRDRERVHQEITGIHEELNEVFSTALQELSEMSTGLTPDDLLFCVLNYMNLSTPTIKICMKVESSQALSQRKYRIKKHLQPSVFCFVFGASITKEINN